MKVKFMDVYHKKIDKMLIGVKIQVNNRRIVYVAKDNKLIAVESYAEAEVFKKEVEDYLENNPDVVALIESKRPIIKGINLN